MRYSIICDNCGMELNVNKFNTTYEDLKGNKVKVQSYACPKCDERYTVAVFDAESDRLRDSWKSLEKDFKELESIPSGPQRDERARVLLKERDQRKRLMIAHNSRLKARYLKELKRHGKRK